MPERKEIFDFVVIRFEDGNIRETFLVGANQKAIQINGWILFNGCSTVAWSELRKELFFHRLINTSAAERAVWGVTPTCCW